MPPANELCDVIDFLKAQEAGEGMVPEDLRVEQTHISVVVLKGNRAWKLKRSVRFPYVDFSTPEKRLAACRQEVRLNRRTAETLYLAARRITREADNSLAFDGEGQLVEAVVEMQRFDDSTLFSRLAARGALDRPLLSALAQNIASFHRSAETHAGVQGAAAIEAVLSLNEQCPDMAPLFGADTVQHLRSKLRAAVEENRALLDARGRDGKIRQCHGDLHLRNICLLDGRPTLFDCIEFNDSIAIIDVLYDLAFLLMDLWQMGLANEANWLMNRYIDDCDESDGLRLLPFLMALRASIRAQVLATQARYPDAPARGETVAQAQAYFSLAGHLLTPSAPQLLAIGGLSGTGKSTFAAAIAHEVGAPPGARILASDRIRKQLAGVPAGTRLPSHTYTPESSRQVYDVLYERAGRTLAAGTSVIADAVFSRSDERQAIEQCALQTAVPFKGVWLEANVDTLLERVAARRADPSDATPEVVLAQLRSHSKPLGWLTVASDSPPTAAVLSEAVEGFVPAWSEAPDGWEWCAQDADGRWFWYAVEPQLGMAGGIWRAPRRAQQYAGQGAPEPRWYETCRQRPATTYVRGHHDTNA